MDLLFNRKYNSSVCDSDFLNLSQHCKRYTDCKNFVLRHNFVVFVFFVSHWCITLFGSILDTFLTLFNNARNPLRKLSLTSNLPSFKINHKELNTLCFDHKLRTWQLRSNPMGILAIKNSIWPIKPNYAPFSSLGSTVIGLTEMLWRKKVWWM